jgi:hypothetical protein
MALPMFPEIEASQVEGIASAARSALA